MPFETLIDPDTLHQHLQEPNWVVVDCRFNLQDPQAGSREYDRGHIPGACYAHLDRDLAGPVTASSGRHPLPDPRQLVRTLCRWGIGRESQVVAYDDGGGAFAARLWWLLRWIGHSQVAVLDGGLSAWTRAGYPLSTDRCLEREASNCPLV
ncbi:MAG: rhodanese-like domain-containing protein, partial [Candidatus Competibacteraceae bacterium]|nr:rhodanese-like domain-containing protein [Candidatus Competibacteraceae bacterium]